MDDAVSQTSWYGFMMFLSSSTSTSTSTSTLRARTFGNGDTQMLEMTGEHVRIQLILNSSAQLWLKHCNPYKDWCTWEWRKVKGKTLISKICVMNMCWGTIGNWIDWFGWPIGPLYEYLLRQIEIPVFILNIFLFYWRFVYGKTHLRMSCW